MTTLAARYAVPMPHVHTPSKTLELDLLLDVPDVARLLRLTPKGVYAMVAARRIPFLKVSNRVRFLRTDVLAWLHENRVPSLGEK